MNKALAAPLWCGIAPQAYRPEPEIAVSLRELSANLRQCGKAGAVANSDLSSPCKTYLQLGGMTRLDGIALDSANRDILLWGRADQEVKPLQLDDFVVALRSAFGRYTQVVNGQTVRYAPAISLDPIEPGWRQYNQMIESGEFDRRFDIQSEAGRKLVEQFCRTIPMTIRVDGLERHSRLAQVLVEADFRMKLVGSGLMMLKISDPFPSSDFMTYESWQYSHSAGVNLAKFESNPTRFWFTPGEFRVDADWQNGVAHLATSQILLKDAERGYIASGKESVDIEGANPFRRAFTCSWSERMDEVIASEWIWTEMFNVFRHIAVATLIREQGLVDKVGLDLSYLLDEHKIKAYPMPDVIYRRSDVMQLSSHGFKRYYGSCGGVSVGFNDATLNRVERGGAHREIAARVIGSRPAHSALSWRL